MIQRACPLLSRARAAILVAAGLGGLGPVAVARAADPPRAVEPIVQLDSGRIVACGVQMVVGPATSPVTVTLLNRRAGDRTEIELRATAGPGGAVPRGVALATASQDTARLLPPARATSDGAVTAGPLDPTLGAVLIQELMLSGATVRLAASGPSPSLDHRVPGPLPQHVRAAYLNCAGDLFPRTR